MNTDGHRYFVGVDLGQRQDYTAIAVVERSESVSGVDRETFEERREVLLQLRYLERVKLGTPYPEVVARVLEVVTAPALAGRCTLVVDATGVGAPVVDLLKREKLDCRMIPVSITGGEKVTVSDGCWRVPKRDLVVGLQVLLDCGKLLIADRLADAAVLVKELMNMRVKISGAGHDQYAAAGREGAHDDLVLAVALACWKAGEQVQGIWGRRRLL